MIPVVAGILRREGRILIARRPEGRHMGGKWEFPGGKIEEGETPEEALSRELYEELGIQTRTGHIYHATVCRYPEKTVLLLFYESEWLGGQLRAIDEAEAAWVFPEQLEDYDFAPADRDAVRRLIEEASVTVGP